MENAVLRLEAVAQELERITQRIGGQQCHAATGAAAMSGGDRGHPVPPSAPPLLPPSGAAAGGKAYAASVLGPVLKTYLEASAAIGAQVQEQAEATARALRSSELIIAASALCAAPQTSNDDPCFQKLLAPLSEGIKTVDRLQEGRPPVELLNHLKAAAAAVLATSWLSFGMLTPVEHIQECIESADYFLLRIRKSSEKDGKDAKWAAAISALYTALRDFVASNFKSGLQWNPRGRKLDDAAISELTASGTSSGTAKAGQTEAAKSSASSGSSMQALFKQINSSSTASLRKVDPSMQTHKNPALRAQTASKELGAGSASSCAKVSTNCSNSSNGGGQATASNKVVSGTPRLVRQGLKWLCEFQRGNRDIKISDIDSRCVVYIYGCTDCTIAVTQKCNSITLDSCTGTTVIVDSVISTVEAINCSTIEFQINGVVPTVSVEKTAGARIQLAKEALGTDLITSMTSAVVVILPPKKMTACEDEIPEPVVCFVPEQLKSVISPSGSSLITTGVEHMD